LGQVENLDNLGHDIALTSEQSPDGLYRVNKAELVKWWPIMKAAGIKRAE